MFLANSARLSLLSLLYRREFAVRRYVSLDAPCFTTHELNDISVYHIYIIYVYIHIYYRDRVVLYIIQFDDASVFICLNVGIFYVFVQRHTPRVLSISLGV